MGKQSILLMGSHLRNIQGLLDNFDFNVVESSGNRITLLENLLKSKRFEPEIAFIHLSIDDQKSGVCSDSFTRPLLELLPETTRRIIVCNGIRYPEQAKNVAIGIHGDMLIDGNNLCYKFFDELWEKGTTGLHQIIAKGYVSQDEINQRGKTIEYVDRMRDEISAPPERDRGFEPHEYSDDYFRRK